MDINSNLLQPMILDNLIKYLESQIKTAENTQGYLQAIEDVKKFKQEYCVECKTFQCICEDEAMERENEVDLSRDVDYE